MTIYEIIPLLLSLMTFEADPLIFQLGDKNFHKREEATLKLEEMGQSALFALKLAKHSADLEISRRSKEIINNYYKTAPFERLPWISLMGSDYKITKRVLPLMEKKYAGNYYWRNAKYWLQDTNLPQKTIEKRQFTAIQDFYLKIAFVEMQNLGVVVPKSGRPGHWIRYRIATHLYIKDLLKWGISKKRVEKMVQSALEKMPKNKRYLKRVKSGFVQEVELIKKAPQPINP